MLSALIKSRFHTKCKSLLKMTKTRVDTVKKKKSAVVKYLKTDLKELIQSGLDYNAYCRAEGLLIELDMLACYDLIDQFCACISTNLSLMNKQKECPDDCKEAVQSLIYAAARFSEFPELRDLRAVFTKRYGTSLEPFISKEFVEKLNPKPVTKEMKLQLMHDLCQEFSIEWNPKSLDQKLFKPAPTHKEQLRHGSLKNAGEDGYNWSRSNSCPVPHKDNQDGAFTRSDSKDAGSKVNGVKDRSLPKMEEFVPPGGKAADHMHKHQSSSEDEVFTVSRRESTDQDSLQASTSSMGSVSEDETDSKQPFYYRFIPPPYVRQKAEAEKQENRAEGFSKSNGDVADEKIDDVINDAKPKPRSVRRKPLKAPQAYQTDEEEKMMDGLLMHYSKKESPHEPENASPYLKRPGTLPICGRNDDPAEAIAGRKAMPEIPSSSGGSAEGGTPVKGTRSKSHYRAVSLQPEMLSGHVHPKPPDFDELAARVAALKGR